MDRCRRDGLLGLLRIALAALGVAAVACASGGPGDAAPSSSPVRAEKNAAVVWRETQRLSASDPELGDYFGSTVSISGNTAFVGVPGDGAAGDTYGSVYVFTRTGTTWSELQKLEASDGESTDYFGSAISVSGDTALVGAFAHAQNLGQVYVFSRSGSTWIEGQKLVAPDGVAGEAFGRSVALSGDVALIGAHLATSQRGAAYVFRRTGTMWSFEQRLGEGAQAAMGDLFGISVSLAGDTAVVGANQDGDTKNTGTAFVFTRSSSQWSLQQRLQPPDGDYGDHFGKDVSVVGDTLLVGSLLHDDGFMDRGAAYVFVRAGTTWSLEQKLQAPTGRDFANFGSSVVLSSDLAIVGAPFDDAPHDDSGSVFVFTRSGSSWSFQQQLGVSDSAADQALGESVALSGDTALVGADRAGMTRGAAYTFVLRKPDGDPCVSGTECHSTHCADERCCDLPCAGECDACSVATGADRDGACKIFAAGSLGAPPCAPLACTGLDSACSPCAADAHCPDDTFCADGGRCEPRKIDGEGCDLDAGADCEAAGCRACESGYCVDGVCCDAACGGQCEACTTAKKGDGFDGRCDAVSASTDPDDECPADPGYPESCGADGECDGRGRCRGFAIQGTGCGDTTCAVSTITGWICDGDGGCENGEAACAPYRCSGEECATTCAGDDDCDTGVGYCNAAQRCVERKSNGDDCARANECASGYCADGYCCNRACLGQCESCAEPDAAGECVPVTGAPRLDREPCPDDAGGDPCRASECDGEVRDACNGFAGPSVVCREESCEDGLFAPAAFCDGLGDCALVDEIACGAYRCAGTRCGESCSADADCTPGNRCEENRCFAGATCSDDGLALIDEDSLRVDCAPYRCSGGMCLLGCDTTAACAPGFSCNPGNQRCEATATQAAEDDAGCACRAVSAPRHSGGPRLSLLATLFLFGIVCMRRATLQR